MKINEMPLEAKVVLRVLCKGSEFIEFESQIKEYVPAMGKKNGIAIPIIRHDDKIVKFNNVNGMEVYITNPEDNRVYRYRISNFITDKKSEVNLLFSYEDVKPINYRDSIRVGIFEKAIMRMASNAKAVDCFTRNISISGILVSVENTNSKVIVGDEARCAFTYNNKDYKVCGTVTRVELDESNRVPELLVGIKFNNESDDVTKLVVHLQRLELQRLKLQD